MPICIECHYPVPQLYHVLHSSKANANNKSSAPGSRPKSTPADTTIKVVPPPPSTEPRFAAPPAPPGGVVVNNKNSELAPPLPTAGFIKPKPLTDQPPLDGVAQKKRGGGGGGGDVRLTQCPRCRGFADKYVEHDFVVLFIDLVLVKPQVYRHLLFNRLGRDADELDASITRLGILLVLFDVYLTWTAIESLPLERTAHSPIPHLPILLQYAFYLLLSLLTTLAQHLTTRWLVAQWLARASSRSIPSSSSSSSYFYNYSKNSNTTDNNPAYAPNTSPTTSSFPSLPPTPSAISTALFVSSNMKLFPLLMVVWKYDDPNNNINKGVEWAVAVQNLEALRILLGCPYWVAGALVGGGWLAGWVVGWALRGVVGLGV